ncbi:MAG: ferrochelatase, partial [Candidatus Acidiferrales bacterium]
MSAPLRRNGPRTAVVLFQLGGPDSLEAVEPFLFNLFSDPDIIDFPFARLAREPLARLMARRRAGKVRQHYAAIGGRSPIIELTQAQAAALEAELAPALSARALVAMRYWGPKTAGAVEGIRRGDFEQVVLLPLYPQYSRVTTGSSLNEWKRRCAGGGDWLPETAVERFFDHPLYLDAVVERINRALARFPAGVRVHLLFSAHGIPESVVRAGDPYQRETEETVRLVRERGGWPLPASLCYQSRVGPGRWLGPMLHDSLESLRAAGAAHVLVVP